MATLLEVTIADGRPAIALPPEIAKRLGVCEGGSVTAIESAAGVVFVRATEHEVAEQLEVACRVMIENREVLRKLAE